MPRDSRSSSRTPMVRSRTAIDLETAGCVVLRSVAALLMLPACTTVSRTWRSCSTWAEADASQPVRVIVGFAAGGPNDILARLIGQWLAKRLGRPFVIENRPGAGSNTATEAVVHARPDGNTLLLVGSPNAINA